jgi:hypothetical protein
MAAVRRTALVMVLAGVWLPAAAPPAGGAGNLAGIRLKGSFTMHGTLTFVDNVHGEHRGGHVVRTWTFVPRCQVGACQTVTLRRQRSGQRILDVVQLHRRGRGLYVGTGRFWIALRCAGSVVRHGGLATEIIRVRVTRTTVVGRTPEATTLSATYDNPSRQNLTRCPGGIGRDAATYTGRVQSPPPAAQ